MKPFLILQLRPETDAADAEFASILGRSELPAGRAHRVRLDRESLPEGLDVTDYAAVIFGGGPGCVSDPPAQKSPRDARMEAAIMALMSAINILPRWFNEKGKLSPETLAESYSHVFTYGLAAR